MYHFHLSLNEYNKITLKNMLISTIYDCKEVHNVEHQVAQHQHEQLATLGSQCRSQTLLLWWIALTVYIFIYSFKLIVFLLYAWSEKQTRL